MIVENRPAKFVGEVNARVEARECSIAARLDTMKVIPGAGAYPARFETD